MQIYLSSLGCRLNEAELELWARQFHSVGHAVVTSADDADLIVLNSCAVTQEAVRKSRQRVNRFKRDNPDARVVVSGCYVSLQEDAESAEGTKPLDVDLVVHNSEKSALVSKVCDLFATDSPLPVDSSDSTSLATKAPAPENQLPEPQLPERWIPLHPVAGAVAPTGEPAKAQPFERRRQRAFIKIQDGCRYRCTYCVVTLARGAEKSRGIAELVTEVNTLFEEGVREIVLTGVHVGGYGSDTGESLASLLKALIDETSMPRIRFASVEPWDLEEKLLDLMTCDRVMPHMHLPLQSGSDSVLKRMARRCKTTDFANLVRQLQNAVPGFNVTTDIIAGFPGETENEWKQTLDFISEISFGHIHVFPFSVRAGTKAARLDGQLTGDIKKARVHELRTLAANQRKAFLSQCTGEQVEVLWERCSDDSGKSHGMQLHGFTPNYIKVTASIDASHHNHAPLWVNRITPVELKSIIEVPPKNSKEIPDFLLAANPVSDLLQMRNT